MSVPKIQSDIRRLCWINVTVPPQALSLPVRFVTDFQACSCYCESRHSAFAAIPELYTYPTTLKLRAKSVDAPVMEQYNQAVQDIEGDSWYHEEINRYYVL